MLCTALILAQLMKLQHGDALHQPSCVLFDRRTAIALVDYEGLLAFRVGAHGTLRRLDAVDEPFVRLELRDVDGDGAAEVLATETPGNRSARIRIFRWSGRRFVALDETSDRAAFIDLDHDGVPEEVETGDGGMNERGCRTGEPSIRRWRRGKLVAQPREDLVAVLQAAKESDDDEEYALFAYLADDRAKQCRLRVINGAHGGRNRVTSLAIRARDVDDRQPAPYVATPLGRGTEFLDLPVTLPTRCSSLDVRLTGPAGALVTIEVTAAPVPSR